jgi:hypothetical protein
MHECPVNVAKVGSTASHREPPTRVRGNGEGAWNGARRTVAPGVQQHQRPLHGTRRHSVGTNDDDINNKNRRSHRRGSSSNNSSNCSSQSKRVRDVRRGQ